MINSICKDCGKSLPAIGVVRICPACLIDLAITGEDVCDEPGFTQVPSVAELAPFFSHLELSEFIGRGGMGLVYRGWQPELKREVAVKILPFEAMESSAAVPRFRQEARVLAKLDHPGIVKVYDFGEQADFFYLVMEWVGGADLASHLANGKKFAYERALKAMIELGKALAYAHGQGMIHRDIKPSNLLLTEEGRVKVADFGLVKVKEREASESVVVTTEGERLGTPHYAAPEQNRGEGTEDERVDVYAAGVVFYEMLTGQLPQGRFAMASETPGVDSRCDGVILKALAGNVEERYGSVQAFLEDLESLRRPPIVERRKFLWGILGAAGLAGVGSWVFWPEDEKDEPERDIPWQVTKVKSPKEGDWAGYQVAVGPGLVLVGATQRNFRERFGPGFVAILRRGSQGWSEAERLEPPEGGKVGDQFTHVIMGDGEVMVGSSRANRGQGKVFVYRKKSQTWKLVQILKCPGKGGMFGGHMATDGEFLAVSAYHAEGMKGATFLYKKRKDRWEFEQAVRHPKGGVFGRKNRFGATGLALKGNTLVVAAHEERPLECGSISIFELTAEGQWDLVKHLRAPNPHRGQRFGSRIVFDGKDRLIVSARGDRMSENDRWTGSLYLIERVNGQWKIAEKLRPQSAEVKEFGTSLAKVGDVLWVGAPKSSIPGVLNSSGSGAVFRYRRKPSGRGWKLEKEYRALTSGGNFGHSLAADEEKVVIGAISDSSGGLEAGGLVILPLDSQD